MELMQIYLKYNRYKIIIIEQMNIINSYITNNKEYKFIKLNGDCSKKQFFRVLRNGKYIDVILISISQVNDDYDEYFDVLNTNLSQYDYFKHVFDLLHNTIGNVPKIIACDDTNGLILMDWVGPISIKDIIFGDDYTREFIRLVIKIK